MHNEKRRLSQTSNRFPRVRPGSVLLLTQALLLGGFVTGARSIGHGQDQEHLGDLDEMGGSVADPAHKVGRRGLAASSTLRKYCLPYVLSFVCCYRFEECLALFC